MDSTDFSNESSLPLEITITENLQYQVESEKYSPSEIEKIIIAYQSQTKDPPVNVRMANPPSIPVGDLGKLGYIAFKQHLDMVFYTE